MRLLFKQRMMSWLDSYDIYDEYGKVYFTVEGKMSFGHSFEIFDKQHRLVGNLKQKMMSVRPTYEFYDQLDNHIGKIVKKLSIKPRFELDFNGWSVKGDLTQWDYEIIYGNNVIATISKDLWNFTDTYIIDVESKDDALAAVLVVIAIDAIKCIDRI